LCAADPGADSRHRARGQWRAALAAARAVVNLQPSELMKLFAALYAADYTVRKLPLMGSF
jgi:hypothetical protein